ncbi:MAG: hypothetical protein V4529_16735 [Gemmatimonadota bacterium]
MIKTDWAKWFLVASAPFDVVDPILDDGTGPVEEERTVMWIRASDRRRARVLMVRVWRRRTKGGLAWRDAPWLIDHNPFAGMSVECAADIPVDFDDDVVEQTERPT